MLDQLFLALISAAAAPDAAVPAVPATLAPRDSFEDRYQAARSDADLLWELYEWCAAPERADAQVKNAAKVLRRIVDLEPEHVRARKQLGHVREDGRWFENERDLARHRRVTSVESKKARGFVRFRRDYAHPDAVPLLRKGMRFDPEHGMWLAARDRRRLENGWRLQDEQWIRSEDAAHIDEGLWLVDGDWLPLERAEQLRSKVERMWTIPGPSIRLHATVRREVARKALHEMNGAVDDLRHVFGVEPLLPLDVCLLRTEEQYDRLAVGDAEGRRAPTQARGLHVAYSAYFAGSWFTREEGARAERFNGMGVSYWNEDYEYGDLYGVHNARLAAALSYIDRIDPSHAAVQSALDGLSEGSMPGGYAAAYEGEKVLPAWLRWGGAVYAERFFVDQDAAADRSRTWPRDWSVDNLREAGGLGDIEELLRARVDPGDLEGTRKLLIGRGLLVAFLVDGNEPVVQEAHAQLKRALASRDQEQIVAATDTVELILARERGAILAFAGL